MLISQTKLFFFSINQVPGIAKTGTGQRRILGKRPMQRRMQTYTIHNYLPPPVVETRPHRGAAITQENQQDRTLVMKKNDSQLGNDTELTDWLSVVMIILQLQICDDNIKI